MKHPGSYTLKEFLLTPLFGTRQPLDITMLIPAFEIIESIGTDSIRGSANVIDSTGILESYPIRGEERATITIVDAMKTERVYQMFLYKVDNIALAEANQAVSYNIYFTSYQRWSAGTKSVTAAYDLPPSEIAVKIYNDYYAIRDGNNKSISDLNKDLIVETLNEPIRITLPNIAPMRAMSFLSERSYSLDSPSCSFRFFESADAFFFVSDEFMYKQAKETGLSYAFTNAYIPRTPETFTEQMNNLEYVKVPKQLNSVEDLTDGSYKSTAYVMDLNFGLFKEFKYDYSERKSKYFGDATITDRHSDDFINKEVTQGPSRKFYIVQMYDDSSYGSVAGNQHYPEIVTDRIGYRKQLQALTISASGPGRLDVTCGNIIDFVVRSLDSSPTPVINDQLSGDYIVHTVTKSFNMDVMTNSYTLIKRGWTK